MLILAAQMNSRVPRRADETRVASSCAATAINISQLTPHLQSSAPTICPSSQPSTTSLSCALQPTACANSVFNGFTGFCTYVFTPVPNCSTRLRSQISTFHVLLAHFLLPGHVSSKPNLRSSADVFFDRVLSNHPRSLDENCCRRLPHASSIWSINSSQGRPEVRSSAPVRLSGLGRDHFPNSPSYRAPISHPPTNVSPLNTCWRPARSRFSPSPVFAPWCFHPRLTKLVLRDPPGQFSRH